MSGNGEAAAGAGGYKKPADLDELVTLLKTAAKKQGTATVHEITQEVGERLFTATADEKEKLMPAIKYYLYNCEAVAFEHKGTQVGQRLLTMAKEADFVLTVGPGATQTVDKPQVKQPVKETLVPKGKSFDVLAKHAVFAKTAAQAMEVLTTGDDKLTHEAASQLVALDWTKDTSKKTDTTGIITTIRDGLKIQGISSDRQLLQAWRNFSISFATLLEPEDATAWKSATQEITDHLIIPLMAERFQAADIATELEEWFLRRAKTSMIAHVANTAEMHPELEMLAAEADMSVHASEPFWPTLSAKLDVTAYVKEKLRKKRDAAAVTGVHRVPHDAWAKRKGPFEAVEAMLGKYDLPSNWQLGMKALNACPLHTLFPGLCWNRGLCPWKHPDDATTLAKHRTEMNRLIGGYMDDARLLFEDAMRQASNIRTDAGVGGGPSNRR